MPGPIATIGSMHTCPICGKNPHVGGLVIGPGAPNVLINGKPAAVMGDKCICAGSVDTIVQGNPSILINGKPAVSIGHRTAHGGVITVGDPTILISTATPQPATTPLSKIPFPEINAKDRLRGGAEAKAAKDAMEEVRQAAREETEGEPKIYNLQWVKEETVIREGKVLKQVTLRASVMNMNDGESITFKVNIPAKKAEDGTEGEEEQVVELTGTVEDKKVEVIWEVEESTEGNEETHAENP